MFIRSDRLFLRPSWAEDAGELTQALSAGVMSNIAEGDLARDWQGTPAATARHERLVTRMLITLPSASGSEVIGGIALGRVAECAGAVRLGYWLARHRWGHGYAAEAARGVLTLARALGYRRVCADQTVDDRASLLVLTRAGFRPTGERRIDGDREAAVYVAEIGGDVGDDCDEAGEARAA